MAATSRSIGAPPVLELLAEGQPLGGLKAVSVQYQHSINRIPWMEIVLSSDDGEPENHDDEIRHCMPGCSFTLRVKGGEILFDGVVTRLFRNSNSSRSEMKLIIRSLLHRLTVLYRSQVFEKKSDAEIINTLCNEQSIRIDGITGLNIRYPQMVQFRCSDWQFILARLKANGVWLVPGANSIRIEEPKLSATPDHLMRPRRSNTQSRGESEWINIDEAFWRFDISDLPDGIEISNWDPRQQKSVTAKAEAKPLGQQAFDAKNQKSLVNRPVLATRSTPCEPGEMEALVNGLLLDLHLNSVAARFSVAGNSVYAPGQTLELVEFGKNFSGKGIITSVEHFIAQGVWTTTVETGTRDPWSELDVSGVPGAPGTYIGIVEDYQRDPDGLDRFRVRIPALIQDNKPLWARFSTPYAGHSHGMYFYPAAGDEVCVMFFDEDPRYPVIVNSLFNPQNPPPFTAAENGVRGLVFDSSKKQQLIQDMQSGAITLEDGEETIVMNQGISLKTNKHFKVNAQTIQTTTTGNTDIQAKSSVSIKGAKIELER